MNNIGSENVTYSTYDYSTTPTLDKRTHTHSKTNKFDANNNSRLVFLASISHRDKKFVAKVRIRMILASVMKTISLTQLLSSCMDASRQGCEVRNTKVDRAGSIHFTHEPITLTMYSFFFLGYPKLPKGRKN